MAVCSPSNRQSNQLAKTKLPEAYRASNGPGMLVASGFGPRKTKRPQINRVDQPTSSKADCRIFSATEDRHANQARATDTGGSWCDGRTANGPSRWPCTVAARIGVIRTEAIISPGSGHFRKESRRVMRSRSRNRSAARTKRPGPKASSLMRSMAARRENALQ